MKTLWFIRHAESLSNAGQPTHRPDDIALSDHGKQQAAALAARWTEEPELMVVSRYQRTSATAEPFRQKYAACEVMTLPVHEFTFLQPALYAGTTEAMRREPVRLYWERCDPDSCDGEGAESFRHFCERVDASVAELITRQESRIAIFCHGYVIKAILWRLLHPAAPITEAYMRGFHGFHRSLVVPNAAVYPILVLPGGEIALRQPMQSRAERKGLKA